MYKDVAGNLNKFDLSYPKTNVPKPSESDYQIGFIRRFFLKKANDSTGHIFEVDRDVFNEYIKNPFWVGDTVKWRISGPLQPVYDKDGKLQDKGISESNKAGIALAFGTLKNLNLYLPNLLQFYKG